MISCWSHQICQCHGVQLGVAANASAPEDLPAQLLFVHAGQTDMKEAHWHPQVAFTTHSG